MASWQLVAARAVKRWGILSLICSRGYQAVPASPHLQSHRGVADPILPPNLVLPGRELVEGLSHATPVRSTPFMQLMAVPKRKVTPSRKGRRNGPKALKPVPVVAKCKVCGRIKLPYLYCCSGEGKVES